MRAPEDVLLGKAYFAQTVNQSALNSVNTEQGLPSLLPEDDCSKFVINLLVLD